MALRDQPYLPLYIQDFMTDEKLIECSAQTTGVYVRLMCIMHKSEDYGKILLKQKDKQTVEQVGNFASKIAKQMPYPVTVVSTAITELLAEGVLVVEGDHLVQKRMVRDNLLSLTRSKAGKKGGEFAQAKLKANTQANTEYEYENESEIDNGIDINKIESRIEVLLFAALGEIYISDQKPKWGHIDFDFEVNTFKEKVRGSPLDYHTRDTAGIRNAFQYQLRNAKKKHNGKGQGINGKQQHTNSLIEGYAKRHGKAPTGETI